MRSIPEDFASRFPFESNSDLASTYSVSRATITRWASKMGLKKDSDYISSIQSKRTIDRVFSADTRQRIREKATGRVISQDSIQKMLATKKANDSFGRGEKHYNWKGGKSWERFKDPNYQTWRNSVLERDQYTCQDCNRKCAKHEKGLAAHHIKPYASYPELRLEIANGLRFAETVT